MAQFVTHIQPTLMEASHHHSPHYHKDTHLKDHHHHHHHDDHLHEIIAEHHHKKPHHVREFPILPHPHVETGHHSDHKDHKDHKEHKEHNGHDGHGTEQKKRDSGSGKYLDSHGVSHTFQLHFVDSQGIYRDCHGHGINKEGHKRHKEEKSPHRGGEEGGRPVPPQFIDLHGHVDNKNCTQNWCYRIEGGASKRASRLGVSTLPILIDTGAPV